jgi:hypothetical protein
MRIADEKVNLAHQIYDFVDKHICSLDKDLRIFDWELEQERSRLGLPVRLSLHSTDLKANTFRFLKNPSLCGLDGYQGLGFRCMTAPPSPQNPTIVRNFSI